MSVKSDNVGRGASESAECIDRLARRFEPGNLCRSDAQVRCPPAENVGDGKSCFHDAPRATSCGDNGGWLLQCSRMADWRQIQARIRKAKTSSDAPAQLAELYERTRDAMVAFELAVWQEKAGDNGEAARWYTSAAQRFRRAQWRTKAEEALTRLGAPIPAAIAEPSAESNETESMKEQEKISSHSETETVVLAEVASEVSEEISEGTSAESDEEATPSAAAP